MRRAGRGPQAARTCGFGQALEKTIVDLIERKYAAPEGSAAYRLAVRELAGPRYTREEAGPIMEDLDPWGWGAVTPNPSAEGPGLVLRLQRDGSHEDRCGTSALQETLAAILPSG
jgi:hypothetical protein